MPRRTKIVATIGPACESPQGIEQLILAGADVIRIGLAHGTLAESVERYRRVRAVSRRLGKNVGILADLPGPKVRIHAVPSEGVMLRVDQEIEVRCEAGDSSAERLVVDYGELLSDLHPGDIVALGDGTIRLQIESIGQDKASARVLTGGLLMGRPGMHVPSERLTLATPTAEDLYKLDAFVQEGVDMVALSFVRSAHDVRRVGTEPAPRGPLVIAKIETRAAVENLRGIIDVAGAVMVARGDLGIELGIEEIPHLQKRIIEECIAHSKPVITATQILESMINAATPTRAEVSDVANAIFDGSSALMLSAETAVGTDPANAVATMARVIERADAEFDFEGWQRRLRESRRAHVDVDDVADITDAVTGAAWSAATELGASAILAITDSGFTVRSMARYRPSMPIVGFSRHAQTVQQLTLSWGTIAVHAEVTTDTIAMMNSLVVQARELGYIRSGDMVAVVAGAALGSRVKSTDTLRLIRVP